MDASGHRFSCRMPFSPTAIGADLFAQKTRERWYRCRGMHPSLRIDSWYQVGILRLRVSFALLSSRLAQDDCPLETGERRNIPEFFSCGSLHVRVYSREIPPPAASPPCPTQAKTGLEWATCILEM